MELNSIIPTGPAPEWARKLFHLLNENSKIIIKEIDELQAQIDTLQDVNDLYTSEEGKALGGTLKRLADIRQQVN